MRHLGAMAVATAVLWGPAMRAQDAADWQAKAGGKMAFDVASVKPYKGQFVPPSFPLEASDSYRSTGGLLRAAFPLSVYIEFAYKLWPDEEEAREIARLPKWVTEDRYLIEARAASGTVTKDQMRLMMQSLLAERFGLAAHFESREARVFALTLAKSGKTGAKLIPHAEGPPCDQPGPSPAHGLAGFPPGCDLISAIREPDTGLFLLGARDVTMDALASSLSVLPLQLGRSVIDRTGLKGRFDFTLEFARETSGPPRADGSGAAAAAPDGPGAIEALRDQLGLKLEATQGTVRVLVVDQVERPTAN